MNPNTNTTEFDDFLNELEDFINSHHCVRLEEVEPSPLIRNFIAIDFETAVGKNACQIGIAVVENGVIVKTINKLIRPQDNKYSIHNINVHHITPEQTTDAPDFAEVWDEIKHYFNDSYVIAHNAGFDISVLKYNLDLYGLDYPQIKGYICTCKLNQGEGLEIACARYDISLCNHHDGEDDAINCAKLYLAYVNGLYRKKDSELPEHLFNSKSKENAFASFFEGHEQLHGSVLQMDLDGADPNNPFYARKVVITGVFDMERPILAAKLKSMGADIDSTVSPRIKYLVIGRDPGYSKLEKVDRWIAEGKDIRKIYQEDLDLIFAGNDYDRYRTELEIPIKKTKIKQCSCERKTTWPNLVERYQQFVDGTEVIFTERELASDDFRLLDLYYKQQQKVPTTKSTVLNNLRELPDEQEASFKRDILNCFEEGTFIEKRKACNMLQEIYNAYGLVIKAKCCVLTEFGVCFDEVEEEGILHLIINKIPEK